MMPVQQVIFSNKAKKHVKVYTNDLEESARVQLQNLSEMPFIHHHIAAMPDVHWGMGATIGSVIPTKGAIIPAAVGVDIGCGMMAHQLDIFAEDLPDNLKSLRSRIESQVPHGRTNNGGLNDKGAWQITPTRMALWWMHHEPQLAALATNHPKLLKGHVNTHRHLGTLGGGNHFIEICLDENNQVWIMLHSGSRGIGNRIGSYFIQLAKKDMERWFINNLPDKNLAYLVEGSKYFDDYIQAVSWAQEYATANREFMMNQVKVAFASIISKPFKTTLNAIQCHHNYIAKEHHFGANVWITRKGALRAREGDMGIIPGSMGVKSFIVRGLGNKDGLHSCSHGAGRTMSRTEAKRRFTAEDLAQQTQGIECRKDDGVVDEIPSSYKDIDVVMENQKDLVEIVHTLHQVLNVKG